MPNTNVSGVLTYEVQQWWEILISQECQPARFNGDGKH